MSVKGKVSGESLRGKAYVPDLIYGKSAYEIALQNGFEGTEEEWLASLKGEKGEKGDVDHTALAEVRRYKYDYDCNGVVDINDAIFLLYHIQNSEKYPIPSWCNGDFNGDGVVNEDDAEDMMYAVNAPSQHPHLYDTDARTADYSIVANSLKGAVSGEAVSMKDVSPLEHNIGVKLGRKNLLDLTSLIGKSVTANGGTLSCGADGGISGSGTATGFVGFESFKLYLPKGKYILSASGTFSNISCAIILNDENGKVLQEAGVVSSGGGFSFNTENYPSFAYITVTIKRNNNVELSGTAYFQIEEGTTATAYVPYVADVSSVTLKKYGGNLIDFSAWNNHTKNGLSFYYEGDGVFHIYGTTEKGMAMDLPYYAISVPAVHDVNYYIAATLLEGSTELNFNPYIGVNDGSKRNWQDVVIRTTTKIGETVKQYKTPNYQFPNVKTFDRFWLYFGTVEANKTIDCRVRVWFGLGTSGEYEPYKCENYNGTVESVPSLYPTTTLLTDTEGVIITAEYNRDINKAFAEIYQAIATMGAPVMMIPEEV